MPLWLFTLLVILIALVCLGIYFLTGLFRVKKGEALIMLGHKGKTKVYEEGWHYCLPFLYFPWRKIHSGIDDIAYDGPNGKRIVLSVYVQDIHSYAMHRHDVLSLISKSAAIDEAALSETLKGYGLGYIALIGR